MTFTEHYAVLNDCPLFWDPDLLGRDIYAARFHPDIPTRIGVIPRFGSDDDIRWFDADPTYVLHWINAFEEVDANGDEIVVVDGFFQGNPSPSLTPDASIDDRLFRYLDSNVLETKPYRWRLNMTTGALSEGFIHDELTEFGMINPAHAGRPYRYTWTVLPKLGAFLFDGLMRTDVTTGATEYLPIRGRRVRQRGADGAAGRIDRRGRRLRRDVHDRPQSGLLGVPRLRAASISSARSPGSDCRSGSPAAPTPPGGRRQPEPVATGYGKCLTPSVLSRGEGVGGRQRDLVGESADERLDIDAALDVCRHGG